MTITAGDQIEGALRLLGILAEGELPTNAMLADGLSAFNQMLDSWSTESLFIYNTIDQTFTWPSGSASRTLGPTGTLVGLRPVEFLDSTYFKDSTTGISFPIKIINQEQYNSIALKTATSTYPQVMWVNMEYPDAEITIYPVPNRDLEFHFISAMVLAQPATAITALAFPPGYMRAFRFNLACEIAPEFGVDPSKEVKRLAVKSLANLKRINQSDDQMGFPAELVTRHARFNIFSGDY